MGFEIPIDVDYFGHPKTLKLISLLNKPEADIYPLRLWRWASSYARDGVLPIDPGQVEASVGWRGKVGRLHGALVEAGFIERDGFTLHSWNDHIGRAICIYDSKKQKQREKWEKSSGRIPEDCRKNSGRIPPIRDTQDTQETREEIQHAVPAAVKTPIPPVLKPTDGATPKAEATRQLTLIAIDTQKSPNTPETLGRTIRAMVERHGGQRVEAWFLDPANVGKSTNEMQDELNGPKAKAGEVFKPAKTSCANCGGTGKVAGGVENGVIVQIKCSRCAPKLRAVT